MRTILCSICMLTTMGAFVARSQEVSPDVKEAAKAIIAKAEVATTTVSRSHEGFLMLSRQQEDGIKPLKAEEKERLARFRSERRALLDLNRKVVSFIKVGESVFIYPGLLALSEVSFNERDNKYSIRLVTDYKGYEGGIARHPTYQVIEFNEAGRITGIKEFATVKMVTN